MALSPAYDSYAPNFNFADGLTRRSPPAGTMPRGYPRLHYQPTLQDALRAGEELHAPFPLGASTIVSAVGQAGGLRNPWYAGWTAETALKAQPIDAARRQRGGVVFTNYCQVCHGPLGQGNGPMTQGGGFPPPASLQAERTVQMKDGQLFHVLTYGRGNVPSFSAQYRATIARAVIQHIRMLQGPYAPGTGSSRFQEVAGPDSSAGNCAACHGPEFAWGRPIRKILPLIPDFTSLAWQLSQTELAIVSSDRLRFGTPHASLSVSAHPRAGARPGCLHSFFRRSAARPNPRSLHHLTSPRRTSMAPIAMPATTRMARALRHCASQCRSYRISRRQNGKRPARMRSLGIPFCKGRASSCCR